MFSFQFSELSDVECWKLTSVSADVASVIFGVIMYWSGVFGGVVLDRPQGSESP
jgi:hypothetical protein